VSRPADNTIPITYQSTVDFLAKPFLVAKGVFTDADATNGVIETIPVGPILTTNPHYLSKIEGFGMLRGTANFKLLLNATPFHQGAWRMHFLPCLADFNATNNNFLKMHNHSLMTKSQQPGVLLTCAETSAELSLPYIAPSDYYDMKSGTFDWGTLYISTVVTLATGSSGSPNVGYDLYVYFTDVELAAPMIPQSGEIPKRPVRRIKTARHRGPNETAIANGGLLSKALASTAEVADVLAEIPMVSTMADTASWLLRSFAGVAACFGFSKPLVETVPQIVATRDNFYTAASTGVDSSFPLSLIHDNVLSTGVDVSHTDQDEMSFAFLKRIEGLYRAISWTDSQAEGTSLASYTMRPNLIYAETADSVGPYDAILRSGPPIYYLANAFSLWRGDIKIRVRVIKTCFHTGRLMFTWTPTRTGSNVPTAETSDIALRHIIDIREGDEICLTLPWYMPTSYNTMGENSGRLEITVINILRRPETASSSVKLLMYVSGGDNLEFASPSTDVVAPPYVPQAGEVSLPLATGGVGGAPSQTTSLLPASSCQGEIFTSVKQLLLRYSMVFYDNLYFSGIEYWLWPWSTSAHRLNNAGTLVTGVMSSDTLCFIAPLYAFRRGGLRFQFSSDQITQTRKGVSLTSRSATTATGSDYRSQMIASPGSHATFPDSVGNAGSGIVNHDGSSRVLSVQSPYHARTRMSLNTPKCTATNDKPSDRSQPLDIINVCGFSSPFMTRAVSDDFSFSYFVGCPPIYIDKIEP